MTSPRPPWERLPGPDPDRTIYLPGYQGADAGAPHPPLPQPAELNPESTVLVPPEPSAVPPSLSEDPDVVLPHLAAAPPEQVPAWLEQPGPPPPSAESVRRLRSWLAVLAVVTATALVVLVAVFFTPWSSSTDSDAPTTPDPVATGSSTLPMPLPVAPPVPELTSKPAVSESAPSALVATKTVTVVPVSPEPTPQPVSRLGAPEEAIVCASGYIAQLASARDEASFVTQYHSLVDRGLVPEGAKATDVSAGCPIFTVQRNAMVLYAGPFESVAQACSARLAGPMDAFIRNTDPASSGLVQSCVCSAKAEDLPQVSQIGEQNQWIGEVQRMLVNRLKYKIEPLGSQDWGVYSAATQQALTQFQRDHGLPADGLVDHATWVALQQTGCG